MEQNLALTWQLSEIHGWGLVGVHTALYLLDHGHPPLLLERSLLATLRPENRERLTPLMAGYERISVIAGQVPDTVVVIKDWTMLHALSNGFNEGPTSARFRGSRNVGVITFEDSRFDAATLERAPL